MFLNYNKPSLVLNYPKKLGITKTEVMKEKKKFKYSKAWYYTSTKSSHRLKFSEKEFKKKYVIPSKKQSYGFGDYY